MAVVGDTPVRELLATARSILEAAGISSAELDAALLLAHVTGRSRTSLWARPDDRVDATTVGHLRRLVDRRARRVPLPYILGHAEFWSLELVVTEDVLCPRPETEGLVEAALDVVRGRVEPRIVDVGTGSGCVAVALAHERPDGRVLAVDRSVRAARVARRNVRRLGLASRVLVTVGDLAGPVRPAVDLVVSNPPYVARDEVGAVDAEVHHEPEAAVYAPGDPEDLYAALARQAAGVVRRGGHLVLELSDTRAHAIRDAVAGVQGWLVTEVREDFAGHPRVLVAERV